MVECRFLRLGSETNLGSDPALLSTIPWKLGQVCLNIQIIVKKGIGRGLCLHSPLLVPWHSLYCLSTIQVCTVNPWLRLHASFCWRSLRRGACQLSTFTNAYAHACMHKHIHACTCTGLILFYSWITKEVISACLKCCCFYFNSEIIS